MLHGTYGFHGLSILVILGCGVAGLTFVLMPILSGLMFLSSLKMPNLRSTASCPSLYAYFNTCLRLIDNNQYVLNAAQMLSLTESIIL